MKLKIFHFKCNELYEEPLAADKEKFTLWNQIQR